MGGCKEEVWGGLFRGFVSFSSSSSSLVNVMGWSCMASYGLMQAFMNRRSNYILWPAVQMINFRLIPLRFQLPFASSWGILWGTYLSLTNSAAEV